MGRIGIIVVLVITILYGCGAAVDPDEVACESGTCWNASKTGALKVNDYPYLSVLLATEVHGYRFPTVKGRSYTVLVRVSSGSAHTYVSPNELIDPKNTKLVDYYSNDKITFTAEKSGDYYIVVQDLRNGSDYSVRIVSYDEDVEPLDGTVLLLLNDYPITFKVIPDEIVRFMFNAGRGNDYTVKVRVTKGKTDTFLSLIPSVDEDIYDLVDWYSNDDIRFRATESGTYFIAVVDRGEITGSDFSIQVTSP